MTSWLVVLGHRRPRYALVRFAVLDQDPHGAEVLTLECPPQDLSDVLGRVRLHGSQATAAASSDPNHSDDGKWHG